MFVLSYMNILCTLIFGCVSFVYIICLSLEYLLPSLNKTNFIFHWNNQKLKNIFTTKIFLEIYNSFWELRFFILGDIFWIRLFSLPGIWTRGSITRRCSSEEAELFAGCWLLVTFCSLLVTFYSLLVIFSSKLLWNKVTVNRKKMVWL